MSVTLNDGLVERKTLERKTESGLLPEHHLLIRKGDIAYNMMRMWQGASGLAEYEGLVSPSYVVTAPKNGIDPRFAAYWFKSPQMIHRFWSYSYGLAKDRLRLYFNDFAKIRVSPPSVERQLRIVRILSAWDTAINDLLRLISAKRELRRGLMHRLLVHSTPPQGWFLRPLGKVADILFSGIDKKSVTGEHPVRLCNYLDVYKNDYITPQLEFMSATATPREIARFRLRKGDVIATKDSETPDDIAKTAIVTEDMPDVVCGYHLAVLRPKPGHNGFFLGKLLMTPQIRYQFYRVANGATRYGLGLSSMAKIPLLVPDEKKQQEIAEVFRLLDQEMGFLSREEQGLRKQKSGLMQMLIRAEDN